MKPLIEKVNIQKSPCEAFSLFKDEANSFFLDSAADPGKLGRFSFIGFDPFLVLKSGKDSITIERGENVQKSYGNPFPVLKNLLKEFKTDYTSAPVPFFGGAVGYFSYDLKDFLEKLPDRAKDDLGLPVLYLGFYDRVIIFDNLKKEMFIASTGLPEKGAKQLRRAKERLDDLKEKIGTVLFDASHLASRSYKPQFSNNGKLHVATHCSIRSYNKENRPYFSNFTKPAYKHAVLKAKEYIKRGDIYQVNLSQRFRTRLNMPAFDLYKVLRDINPAPFAAFLNFGDLKIVSSSPERFLRKNGNIIQTRPIKGTRPRGRNEAEDKVLEVELKNSIKDRAENLMIIDLERNDLGRICDFGSVRVSEFMITEKYSTVFHLVSTVEGKVKRGLDAVDCLSTCFPGGSITGAPKIRAMEIIEELEPVKRSVYTGSIGYIGFNGDMDTSIVIRTFIIKGNDVYFQVGGGIVYDSCPEKEYQETLDKAKALMEAVQRQPFIDLRGHLRGDLVGREG